MFRSSILAVVCLMLVSHTMAIGMQDIEKQILDSILSPDRYDPYIRPYVQNSTDPVVVRVNTYIRGISEIDDIKMEYNAQLTFRMSWTDSRLKYDDRDGKIRYVTLTHPEKIWSPDAFFSNERYGHFHNILLPNVLMRIFPNGDILYSTRITMKLSCPMDLKDYPMDKPMCSIMLASYGYTTEDIHFLWKERDPVQITRTLHLPKVVFNKLFTNTCNSKTNTGEYSCLKIDLHFSRQLTYYLLQVYIPNTFLVILSWITFWLDCRATTARVAIWATIVITMTIMTSSLQAKLPAVSYIKSIDIWTGTCLSFIFAVIIELAVVIQVVVAEDEQRRRTNAAEAAEEAMTKKSMTIDDCSATDIHDSSSKLAPLKRWLNRFPSRGERIDAICRILFPVAFAFFNIFYWSI